jgi:hypothetical protein
VTCTDAALLNPWHRRFSQDHGIPISGIQFLLIGLQASDRHPEGAPKVLRFVFGYADQLIPNLLLDHDGLTSTAESVCKARHGWDTRRNQRGRDSI